MITEAELAEINAKRVREGKRKLSMEEARRARDKYEDTGRSSYDGGFPDFLIGYNTGFFYNTQSWFGSLFHGNEDSKPEATVEKSSYSDRGWDNPTTTHSSTHYSHDSGSRSSYDSSSSSSSSDSGGGYSGGDSGGSSGGDGGGGGGGE